jgi:hypothetical protein
VSGADGCCTGESRSAGCAVVFFLNDSAGTWVVVSGAVVIQARFRVGFTAGLPAKSLHRRSQVALPT